MAFVRGPFTGGNSEFLGTYPYFHMPPGKAPSVRSQAYPPLMAPGPGYRTKAALPPAATNALASTALVPQGPTTYAVGQGSALMAPGVTTAGIINT